MTWDRKGRPGWVVFNYFSGNPRLWVPTRWLARLCVRFADYPADYARPGEGWNA